MHKNRLLFLTLPFLLSSELVLSSSSSSSELTSSPFIPVAAVLSDQEVIENMVNFIENELNATYEIPKEPNQDQSINIWKNLAGIKLKYEEDVAHQKKFNKDREEYCTQRIAILRKSIEEHQAAYASFLKRKPKPKLNELADYNKTYKPFQESLEKELTSLVSSENSKTRNLRASEFKSYKENALKELQTCLPDFNFQEK